MALNSQELLEPWRAGLAKLLAGITPGRARHAASSSTTAPMPSKGAIKLARLLHRRNTFLSTLGRIPRQVHGLLVADGQGLVPRTVRRRTAGRALRAVRRHAGARAGVRKGRSGGHADRGVRGRARAGRGGRGGAAAGVPARGARAVHRYGALLIADEIQTGMGRTGSMWGVDHWNVGPDIMCLGKSIGGGVMPLSAFISTPAIWEVLVPNPVHALDHLRRKPDGLRGGNRCDHGHPRGGSAGPGGSQGRVPVEGARCAQGQVPGRAVRRCAARGC